MFHLAAGSAWLGGVFAGCTQITLLRLAVSAESLRRKTVQVGRLCASNIADSIAVRCKRRGHSCACVANG
jgi:hypothetical protein